MMRTRTTPTNTKAYQDKCLINKDNFVMWGGASLAFQNEAPTAIRLYQLKTLTDVHDGHSGVFL